MNLSLDGYESPVGSLDLVASEQGLMAIGFGEGGTGWREIVPCDLQQAVPTTMKARFTAIRAWLDRYFAGERVEASAFLGDLDLRGTGFQRRVWQALSQIPYGEVRSYADVARAIGQPTAVRAVGMANGRNPLPILLPCHRVIGSDGSLTGYGGGLWRKEKLLALERGGALFHRAKG